VAWFFTGLRRWKVGIRQRKPTEIRQLPWFGETLGRSPFTNSTLVYVEPGARARLHFGAGTPRTGYLFGYVPELPTVEVLHDLLYPYKRRSFR